MVDSGCELINKTKEENIYDYCTKNDIDSLAKELNSTVRNFDIKYCDGIYFKRACQLNSVKMLEILLKQTKSLNTLELEQIIITGIIYSSTYGSIETLEYLILNTNIEEQMIDWDIEFTNNKLAKILFLYKKINQNTKKI